MLINLRTLATIPPTTYQLTLDSRLPRHIVSPCQLHCLLGVDRFSHYTRLTMTTTGVLTLICQRCLHVFSHTYENHTSIAACTSEDWAQKLMSDYETMVVGDDLDLRVLLTDELYLYSPENHPDRRHCSPDIDG